MSAHILVIDDEPSTARMISLMLTSKKYQASCASNGQEGLDLLTKNPDTFQLVLLDMMMPVLDGLGFLAGFNSEPHLRHIPVILQTGVQSSEEIDKALALGVRHCLRKPFERAELIHAVQTVLGSNL